MNQDSYTCLVLTEQYSESVCQKEPVFRHCRGVIVHHAFRWPDILGLLWSGNGKNQKLENKTSR